jgi:hypothetical protein
MNIIRELALNVLRMLEAGEKIMSLRSKRFAIGTNPEKHSWVVMDCGRRFHAAAG